MLLLWKPQLSLFLKLEKILHTIFLGITFYTNKLIVQDFNILDVNDKVFFIED
jgi:hypothetical protein